MAVEWVHEFNFTEVNDRWTRWSQNTLHGDYIPSVGWRTNVATVSNITDQRIYVERVFSATTITQISVTFRGPSSTNPNRSCRIYDGAGNLLKIASNYPVNVDNILTWTPGTGQNLSKIVVQLACGVTPTPPPDAYGYITQIVVKGVGENPFVRSGDRRWCHEFDFLSEQGDWLPWSVISIHGEYILEPVPVGWRSTVGTVSGITDQRIYIERVFPQEATVTEIEVVYSGPPSTNPNRSMRIRRGDTEEIAVRTNYPTGVSNTLVWVGSRAMNKVVLHLACGVDPNPPPNAYGYITKVVMRGTGENRFVPTYDALPTGGGETIWTYRAPITGNSTKLISEYLTTAIGVPIVVDSYAIDPLTRHLWLHSGNNWFKTTATDRVNGTTLRPSGCNWVEDAGYTGNDRIIIPPLDTATFRLTFDQIRACISNGVADASYTLPQLANVPFEGGIPQFTRFPLSMEQVCQGTPEDIRGLGVPPEGYGVSRLHNGTDVFAPSGSDVYSIADNGLVVGIGISLGLLDDTYSQRSANYWRAAAVEEGVGYSVIVRYRHLYVLFGHLMHVDPNIYVGKQVNLGTRLGEIGTYPDSDAHLHVEIRSFGGTPPGDSLVKDATGANNVYGILANGGSPAPNVYDILQFFGSNTQIAEVDNNQPSDPTLNVTGLGINIDNGAIVTFSGTPVNTLSCILPVTRPYATQLAPKVGDYRGFVLGIYPNQAPADPAVVT